AAQCRPGRRQEAQLIFPGACRVFNSRALGEIGLSHSSLAQTAVMPLSGSANELFTTGEHTVGMQTPSPSLTIASTFRIVPRSAASHLSWSGTLVSHTTLAGTMLRKFLANGSLFKGPITRMSLAH